MESQEQNTLKENKKMNLVKNTEKGKKIEVTLTYTPKDIREAIDDLVSDGLYSDIDEICEATQRQYRNGGIVRQPYTDGVGRSRFEWVFGGNAKTPIDTRSFSDTCDLIANPDWSLGTNTLEIEAKLRRHKQQEGYTEVIPKKQRRGGKREGAGRPKIPMVVT